MTLPVSPSALVLPLAVALSAMPAAAQVSALPVQYFPNIDPGLRTVMLHADWRIVSSNAGDLTPVAGRIVLNLGRVGVAAGAGLLYDSELDDELSLGGSVGIDLYSVSPSSPTLTIQGAVGYTEIGAAGADGIKRWDIPVGIGFSWFLPALDYNVEPWVAPRVHLRRLDGSSGTVGIDETSVGFGISGGLSVTHAFGPGLHLAVEALLIDEPLGDKTHVEFALSGGIQAKFALP
jgi:hypothetical protein